MNSLKDNSCNMKIGNYEICNEDAIHQWLSEKDKITSTLKEFNLDNNDEIEVCEDAVILNSGSLKVSATLSDGRIELATLEIGRNSWEYVH